MNKRVLLIADDDEMSRKTIIKYFSDYYDVLEARNGGEALDIIHNRHVDIVILDIIMPELTGYDVLQQVKCDEKYSDVRILVATSLQEKTERQALELGADDIVFKPYDPVVIKKRIDNLLLMQDQKRELEQALLKAEQANKAKTDFLSRVSHDMRTPLTGILGITALLKDSISDEESYKDLLQLEASGQYLLNLINDTLDVNKIEVGKLELHPGVYDCRAALKNIVGLFKPNLDSKNIHFNLYTENLPYKTVYIDMGRFEQVIMNIVGNSAKFTPEGGNIDVYVSNISVDDEVVLDRIVIKDNGCGMSSEFLPHLFEPFTQEANKATKSNAGTGLGMTITRQIVELMGGSIAVKSELGKGTEFTIEIPMPIATPEQIKNWNRTNNFDYHNYDFRGKRILLCEDHPLNAQIATRLLEKKGIIVEHAANGADGVEMFTKSEPDYYDLILMDIRMPIMNGLEATRAIRGLSRKDAIRIPIVAMTANAFSEDAQESKDAGMNAHVGKPIEVDKLFGCIADMLHLVKYSGRKQVLIVDDIQMNRSIIKEALYPEYDVYEAEDGYKALDFLKNNGNIDLIITDIQMPVMDGLDLIRRIRSDSLYDHITIIANTQFGDPEQEEEILSAGADDFVYKPTTPKIVELRVRNVMNRK